MNVTVPPIDNIWSFQQESLAIIFSNNGFQVTTFIGLDQIEMRRKEKVLSSTLHDTKLVAATRKLEFKFSQITLLLWKLTPNPETISKPLKIDFIAQTFFQFPYPMKRVSSSNCSKSNIYKPRKEKPLNSPISEAFLTKHAKPSTTITKKEGERGSPYRKPLSTSKSFVGISLTKTDI